MKIVFRNLKIYIKFLSKNKLYTFVSIFGFSVSLMFVILLSLYTKQELSVDKFHEKGDRIYLMTREYYAGFANSVAPFVQERCPEVESFCRAFSRNVVVGYKDNEKFRTDCMFVDSTFFEMFSFKLLEGDPKRVLAPQSVVLTNSFANRMFGNEDPIGKSFSVDDKDHIVTGVMEDIPQNTHFPQADFLVSYGTITNYWGDWILTQHNNFGFSIYFLEKEGASLVSKKEFLAKEFKEHLWVFKNDPEAKFEFIALPDVYFEIHPGGYLDMKTSSKNQTKVYIAIVIIILVIATLNYVNMTLAQAGFRGKEAAIKKLLGSSRRSIVRQMMLESFFMTLITFALGLFLVFVCEPFFDEVLNTKLALDKSFTPINVLVGILFVLFLTFASGFLPAVVISNFNPLEVVKGTFSRKVKSSYAKVFITFQYIVAISLLICSFVIKQQSEYLSNYDLGYNKDAIFTMDIQLDTTQVEGFRSKLLAIPEIEKVSFTCGTPMGGGNNNTFDKDGVTYSTQELLVDEEFFDIYGIKTDPSDVPLSEESVFISQTMFDSPLTDKQTMTVLFYDKQQNISGVLSDIQLSSLTNDYIGKYIRVRKRPNGYTPWEVSVKINQSANLFAIGNKIQEAYTQYVGGKPAENPQYVDDMVQQWYKKQQNLSSLVSAFTLLTLLISIMGIFAMSLYMIKQKEKEIGVRKVNGATENEMLWMLNRDSLLLVVLGFVISCPIAYYVLDKWLEDFPYRVSINGLTFALSGVIVALLTLISVSYMTWKAARKNPVESLKSE